jgi:hypothetical protein
MSGNNNNNNNKVHTFNSNRMGNSVFFVLSQFKMQHCQSQDMWENL